MAEKLPTAASIGSLGGKARAERLTPEERSEMARRAVEARWNKAGKNDVADAICSGEIKIGDLEIPCAVLEGGIRVLSETGVVNVLGLYRSGAVHTRARDASEPGAQLPLFVANKNLKPFIDLELASVLQNPIWYRPTTPTGQGFGSPCKGVLASLLPKICNVWLKARDAGVIHGVRQKIVVASADIINRGLAEVGIDALVDEATGYEDIRVRGALAKILERFVAKELQPYMSAFPLDFFRELCRLRGIQFKENMRLPPYFGNLVNDLVYYRLAPGVLPKIQEKNPVQENGRRKDKNYKWLTPGIGHPKLLQLLGSEVTLMRMSKDWDEFKELVDRFHKPYKEMPLFDWAEMENT